jgi:Acetyltransferase (GNAT) domain
MQPIIAPIPTAFIKKELINHRFVRYTNKGENEIYIINHHNAPNIMREVGRLREAAFRGAGGGTGLEIDIDHNDTCEKPYEQLIVWDPREEVIVGGYRFIFGPDAMLGNGVINLSTAHLFNFSEKFIQEFLPVTIELGRSWVHPDYQPTAESRRGIYTLDNLWDGLGALCVDYHEVKYFFGKVTMYEHYNREARDMLMSFMDYYFPDNEGLVTPIHPLQRTFSSEMFLDKWKNLPYKEGHKNLNAGVRALGENIPPLINAYMNLSLTMKSFGTSINDEFGDVEETGILITISDIYPEKTERYVGSYVGKKNSENE